jgi:hypothetical protein
VMNISKKLQNANCKMQIQVSGGRLSPATLNRFIAA